MPNHLPAPARRLALFAVLALAPALAAPVAAQSTRSSTRKHAAAKAATKSSHKASTKSSAKASTKSSTKAKAAARASKPAAPATAPTTAARPDSALRAFQVDTVAEPIPETLVPRYPRELRAREARGSVIAEFVVDTAGKVEPGTFRVISSDDSAFTQSVRDLLPQARFLPAINEGKLVRQTVRQTFVFDVDVLPRPRTGARPRTNP